MTEATAAFLPLLDVFLFFLARDLCHKEILDLECYDQSRKLKVDSHLLVHVQYL